MNRNKFIAGISLLLVLILIGFLTQEKKGDANQNKVITKANTSGLVFKHGEYLRYELLNKSIIMPSASNKFFKKLKIDLLTTFNTRVFKEDGIVYLAIQFDTFNFSVNQNNVTQQVKADSQMFEPLLLTLVDGANIDDILFSNQLSEEHKKQIRGLLYTLQMSFQENVSTWKMREQNANGVYENENSIKSIDNELLIRKSNIEYKAYNSKGAYIEIMDSNITATLDKKSWLKNLNYKQGELYSAQGKVMMRAWYATDLQRIENLKKQTQLHTFKNLDALIKYLSSGTPSKSPTAKALDKLTPKEAVHSFFLCMKDNSCNFLDISRNLMAYLLANPDAYEYVLDLIKDSKYSEYHHQLINMLRDLGTPLAQKAILKIIASDEYTQSNRTQAAVSIGFLSDVTDETIENLQKLRESGLLGEQEQIASYYALGNLASGSQEAYDKIAPSIIEDLKLSTSISDTVNALGALENTENNDVIQYVTPYLDNDNRAVRRGAVEALRLTDSQEATDALFTQLKKEEYDLVINSIAFSLSAKKNLEPQIIKEMAIKTTQKIKKSNDTMMVKAVDFLIKESKTNKDAQDALKVMMGKNLSIEAKKRIIRGL